MNLLDLCCCKYLCIFSVFILCICVCANIFGAIVAGCLRNHLPFLFLLEGRQFQLFTDHKPLVAAMTRRVTPPQSARQQRHVAYISELTTDLSHTPGSENVVADALSRPPPVLEIPAAGLPVLSIPPLSLPSEPPRRTALPVPAVDVQPFDFLLVPAANAQPIYFLELSFAPWS